MKKTYLISLILTSVLITLFSCRKEGVRTNYDTPFGREKYLSTNHTIDDQKIEGESIVIKFDISEKGGSGTWVSTDSYTSLSIGRNFDYKIVIENRKKYILFIYESNRQEKFQYNVRGGFFVNYIKLTKDNEVIEFERVDS
ncbi:MAG: hypothetical protein H6598_08575 [Flavobacteriales bacterium]|nr:hypothetical protein [Flavobacteriales bacterium]MCB9196265.1 hypothetical protein [Flavobacteriales bacterium]